MLSKSFFELHSLIKIDTRKEDTNMRRSISIEEQLAITLRYILSFISDHFNKYLMVNN